MTKNQKKGPAFLLKTYDMLDKQQFKQIIDWNSEGNGFIVKNPLQLSSIVLPKYFKHSNLHSFIRQLNMYGFNKKRGSKVQNFYYHQMFKKGNREMIFQMQRKVQKKGIHKQDKKQQENHNNNQQISIQLQEQSENNNKQNKNNIIIINGRNNININNNNNLNNYNDIQKLNIIKKIIQLKNVNKELIIEQMFHLTNLQQTNLIKFIHQINMNQSTYNQETNQLIKQEENQKFIGNEKFSIQENLILEKYSKAKNLYLKVQSIICEKINDSIKGIEHQYIQKSLKSMKDTHLQISRNNIELKKQSQQEIQKVRKQIKLNQQAAKIISNSEKNSEKHLKNKQNYLQMQQNKQSVNL